MNAQRNSLILLVAIMGAVMAAPYEEPEAEVPAPRVNSSAVQPVVRLAARPPPAVAPVASAAAASPKESSAIAVRPATASSEEAPPEEATIEDLSEEASIPEPFPVVEPAAPAARNNSKVEKSSPKVAQRTPAIEKKENKEAEEKTDVVKPARGTVGADKEEAAPEKPAQKLKKEEKEDQDADAKEMFKREVENFNF